MRLHRLFSCILAASLFLPGLDAEEVRITGLTVEAMPAPVGVESPHPLFSWHYEGEERDFRQKSRRVMVATTPDLLAARTPDLWDSGWSDEAGTLNLPYAGKPLRSGQACHWLAETRGADGRLHTSAPSGFEMGLLDEGDWGGAAWITRRNEPPPAVAVLAEKWTDYEVKTKFRILETCANLHFRSRYIGGNGYSVQIVPGAKDNVKVFRHGGNKSDPLATLSPPAPLEEGAWHEIHVAASADVFSIRIDGVEIGTVRDKTHPAGVPGVGALRDDGTWGRAEFDDFRVTRGDAVLFEEDFNKPALNNFQDLLFVGGAFSQPRDGVLSVRATRSLIEDKRGLEAPLFRKTFSLTRPVRRARAYVCGIGYHEMRLNGRKVGDRMLEPGFSRYDKRVYYSVYDITRDLAQGKNAVGFELGRGWFGIRTPTLWGEYADPSWVCEPKLMACLRIEYEDGGVERILTDTGFRTAPGPVLFDSLKAGETHDARMSAAGWDHPDFDDHAWKQAGIAQPPMAVNLARGRKPAASSSLTAWGWDLGNVVDGDRRSTRPSMGFHSDPQRVDDEVKWLSLDLGAVNEVRTIRLHPRGDHTGGFFPRDFDIQVSDAGGTDEAAWRTIREIRGRAEDTTPAELAFDPPLKTRHLRLKALHMKGTHLALAEWEVFGTKARRPESQLFPPIRVIESVPAVSVKPVADGAWAVDFGKHMSGDAVMKVSGKPGDRVILQYAEKWNEQGLPLMQPFDPLQTGCYQQDTFILAGSGNEVFRPKFSYKGFRYLLVWGFPGVPKPEDFTAEVIQTDMRPVGSFVSSSPLLNAISGASFASIRSNMHSIPTDCPTFEKLGWTCDDAAPLEAMMYGYDVEALYLKRMRDYADDIRPDGSISDVLPSTWIRVGSDPAWNGSLIAIASKMQSFYGAEHVLEEHYEVMKRYHLWLSRAANMPGKPPHIVNPDQRRGYGDWVPPDHRGGHGPDGHSIYQTCYHYWYTTLMRDIASRLGKTADRDEFAREAAAIRGAINARFFDAAAGAYFSENRQGGFRQSSQVLPLYFGIVPDGMEGKVVENLVADIRKRDGHFWVGILGFEYIADVLMKHGFTATAYEGHLKEDFPGLGNMIREGATTLWESYSLATTRSLNHKMFSTISEWMFRDVAGLGNDPEAPGFKRAVFAPKPGPGFLSHAKAAYDSKSGRFECGWKTEGGDWILETSVPPNAESEVVLPVRVTGGLTVREGDTEVWKNGAQAAAVPGIRSVTRAPDGLHISTGSGRFRFSCAKESLAGAAGETKDKS